ncbi:MAG: DUF1592 domain-containing protein [Acidobacteria bacterium]|nr:DUF1592 domain-containing protein [Acidobacteriota bacterium]
MRWPAVILLAAGSAGAAIHPVLTKYCAGCHNQKTRTANIVLDEQREPFDAGLWEEVLTKLKAGQMPPPGAPALPGTERAGLISWVEQHLNSNASALPRDPGRVTVRRLNRTEYNNTVRDLLGAVIRPADDFPADDSGYGFDNIGDVLTLPPVLMEQYMRAAERLAQTVIPLGPPPRPALEKYVADVVEQSRRVEEDDPKGYPFRPGAFEVRHVFPVDAEYELVVRVKDRRNTERVNTPVEMFLDGSKIADFVVQDGEYSKGHFSVRRFVPAGEHVLYAQFANGLVSREQWNEKLYGKALFEVENRMFVDGLDVEGPYGFDPRATAAWKRMFVCADPSEACARRILLALSRRAFRREPEPAEIERLMKLTRLARQQGEPFEAGIRLALKALLVSPQFLFRIEQSPASGVRPLTSVELASRLSYFLWSSMPDDELLSLGISGQLAGREAMDGQVRRMLRDPKAAALTSAFAGQWLQLRNLDKAQPAPDRFPLFTPHLRDSMRGETEAYFNHVMREDRSVLEFIDSDYSFLNARLAKHYGIEGVKGRELRQVKLPSRERGGVLTQAGILTVSSYPTRTSPVLRGLWVLENFLGAAPPPPPAGVPRLEDQKIDLRASLRVQLQQHRADPGCAVCHVRMDAIGFGLEGFDPVGATRNEDASGELPGGQRFEGAAGLKQILLEDRDAFTRTFTEKLMTFALGRGTERYDRAVIREIARDAAADGYRFSAVVRGIVHSPPFRLRRGDTVR